MGLALLCAVALYPKSLSRICVLRITPRTRHPSVARFASLQEIANLVHDVFRSGVRTLKGGGYFVHTESARDMSALVGSCFYSMAA